MAGTLSQIYRGNESYLVGKGHRTQWLPLHRPRLEAYTAQASVAPSSIYPKAWAIIALFLRSCVNEGELSILRFGPPRPKRLRSEIRVLTRVEMLRLPDLVRNKNVRDWAVFMLLLDTGMRPASFASYTLLTFIGTAKRSSYDPKFPEPIAVEQSPYRPPSVHSQIPCASI